MYQGPSESLSVECMAISMGDHTAQDRLAYYVVCILHTAWHEYWPPVPGRESRLTTDDNLRSRLQPEARGPNRTEIKGLGVRDDGW